MKKLTSIILILAMVISILGANIVAPVTVKATATINIGDYVQMGKYYNEPILWRCVDIDANGPLMLADKILTIKPFDAAGNHTYLDGTTQADPYGYRTSYGSNLWETSNMRSWLNSTATAGNVTWPDGCPPIAANLWMGYNAYSTEKGFLANGNFTASERSAIKTVTQKSLLDSVDVAKLKVGGTALHIWDYNISTVVQNYDTAYYHNVTDKMFLLDVKQVNKVYQNLGSSYYIGQPTQKAVDNSEYKDGYNLTTGKNWYYWLRSPSAINDAGCVRGVYANGYVDNGDASGNVLGARPAFYINLSSVIFKSGNGSVGAPYVVDNTTPIDINRQTAITVLIKALGNYTGDETVLNNFTDAADILAANMPYVAFAVQQKWISGYPDGTFIPNGTITRAEIATITCRMLNLQTTTGTAFNDLSGHWAEGYIYAAYNANIITGYADGTFKPDKNLTDVEAQSLRNGLGTVVNFIGLFSGSQKIETMPQAGGQYNVKSTYVNNSLFSNSTNYIVTVKSNNQLISLKMVTYTFAPGQIYTFDNEITLPSLADSANFEIKVMLWENLSNMKPYSMGYLSKESKSGFAASGRVRWCEIFTY